MFDLSLWLQFNAWVGNTIPYYFDYFCDGWGNKIVPYIPNYEQKKLGYWIEMELCIQSCL